MKEVVECHKCHKKLKPNFTTVSMECSCGVEFRKFNDVWAQSIEGGGKTIPKEASLKNKKPSQYDIGIDTFERMKANASLDEIIGACKLNIDKYMWRKKGSDREDLEKAKDYIDLWIWAIDNK